MSDQLHTFVHTRLEQKLAERLTEAINYISKLPPEDVLRCDGGCLTQIVREFAVAPPILRADLMEVDARILEPTDESFERKIGQTNHSIFIPVERDAGWLEEVRNQRTAVDGNPLAFLDGQRSRISIRLALTPADEEGALARKIDYRADLIARYAESVAAKLVEFNTDLAVQMTAELNKRKSALLRAQRELELTGLPRVHNPEHEERAIKYERVLRDLGARMTGMPSRNEEAGGREVRSFIVHGHDHKSLYELKDYLQNTLKLGEPVVLRQTPGLGKTLIEKFEREAELVELVFVLLTPDDVVTNPSAPDDQKRRARQNVILELGFFLGKLGRESGRVLLLHKGPVEIPSDITGIEYIDITGGIESAGENIRRELTGLGIL